ncbi:hypothetical protein R3P38DRAFT_2808435 [Favolaschia claudopus]|uniref:Uncharacterized protein n=1 Tax=Favolaschia claudopus TaxID=2862362 RepID=A0AAV9ZG68_9AGAR
MGVCVPYAKLKNHTILEEWTQRLKAVVFVSLALRDKTSCGRGSTCLRVSPVAPSHMYMVPPGVLACCSLNHVFDTSTRGSDLMIRDKRENMRKFQTNKNIIRRTKAGCTLFSSKAQLWESSALLRPRVYTWEFNAQANNSEIVLFGSVFINYAMAARIIEIPELLSHICAFLFDPESQSPTDDHKAFALASPYFRYHAQERLFRTLDLRRPTHGQSLTIISALATVLRASPHLRPLIRVLRASVDTQALRHLVDMQLTRLEEVGLELDTFASVGTKPLVRARGLGCHTDAELTLLEEHGFDLEELRAEQGVVQDDTTLFTAAGQLLATPSIHTISLRGCFPHSSALNLVFGSCLSPNIHTISLHPLVTSDTAHLYTRLSPPTSDAERVTRPLKLVRNLILDGSSPVIESWMCSNECVFDIVTLHSLRLDSVEWALNAHGKGVGQRFLDRVGAQLHTLYINHGAFFTTLQRIQITTPTIPFLILMQLPDRLDHLEVLELGFASLDRSAASTSGRWEVREEHWGMLDRVIAGKRLPTLRAFTLLVDLTHGMDSEVSRSPPQQDWGRFEDKMLARIPGLLPEMYSRGVVSLRMVV